MIRILDTIEERDQKAKLLRSLAVALADAGEHEQLLPLVPHSWRQAAIRSYAIRLLPLVNELIQIHAMIGAAFYEAFAWVDAFLRGTVYSKDTDSSIKI